MRKEILRSQKLKRLTAFIIKQSSLLALVIVSSIPLKAQLIRRATGLNSPLTVHKQSFTNTTVQPITSTTMARNSSLPESGTTATGTWTKVTALAPDANYGISILLSDGRVLCHTDSGSTGDIYDILTPDSHGSYINGTWSQSTQSHRKRFAFSSDVLQDGRVYVAGGEYGTDGDQSGSHAEVYDPFTDTWSAESTPGNIISDGNSEILPDGKILQALLYDFNDLKHTAIYDPATNTYSAGPDSRGVHNESMWVKLPDNSILMVDMQRQDSAYIYTTPPHSERYIPATNTWVADADVPVNLYDPYYFETGPAFLLPDGRAFFMGSTGHTAYYTPSGTTSPGTWTAGPDLPNGYGMPDAPGSMMPNGKILFACSNAPYSPYSYLYPNTTYWFEFDYTTNTYTQVNVPEGGNSYNVLSQQYSLLNLPDGNILAYINQSPDSRQYYVYTPAGTPLVAGKPTITDITQTSCTTYTLKGTQFNGIDEGSAFGDENQDATNYPLVRLTNGTNVYYCRTSSWNSTGVQRGGAPDNVTFTLPAGLPDTTYSLVVTTNGIASDPITITTGVKTWYLDADGDTHYIDSVSSCMSPGPGYTTIKGTFGDCNDNDPSVWQSASLYIDADGDGYDAGQATVCYGATVPVGYSLTTKGSDCNDNDPSVHAPIAYYVDADHDGYGSGTVVMLCSSTAPYGYSTLTGDCNDNNPAINPGAPEICGNGIDDNCNGQIDENCGNCPVAKGTWKNKTATWPYTALPMVLGTSNTYSQAQLIDILKLPSLGDISITLASQLITAKLNYAAGVSATPAVMQAIGAADAAIGSNAIPMKVKPNTSLGTTMAKLAEILDQYNSGDFNPTCTNTHLSARLMQSSVSDSIVALNVLTAWSYPNPFNDMTTIRYTLPNDAHVYLNVYNNLGQLVAKLVNSNQQAGTYQATFRATNQSSGIYHYKLQAIEKNGKIETLTGKMIQY
ncbi:MAG: T9SS type A sorting domain-containing protein [Bacteroidota bacterium]|nr:T9SS type A sorting domain-containing protein [Bacteroidota bacterium]